MKPRARTTTRSGQKFESETYSEVKPTKQRTTRGKRTTSSTTIALPRKRMRVQFSRRTRDGLPMAVNVTTVDEPVTDPARVTSQRKTRLFPYHVDALRLLPRMK